MPNPIVDLSRSHADEIILLRHELHQWPEIAHNEHKTAEILAKSLERHAFEVNSNVAGTGLVADLKSPRPGRTVAIRADIYALPVVEENDLPFKSRNAGFMHAVTMLT